MRSSGEPCKPHAIITPIGALCADWGPNLDTTSECECLEGPNWEI